MDNQNKIKLFIIIPTLQCGGSEKFISLLCNHINSNAFTVLLVVLQNNHPFYQITNPSITVINLHKDRVRYALPATRRIINQFNPDIVFSAANHVNLYLAIFRKLFSKKIKFIARESSIVSLNTNNAAMPFLYHRLIKKYYHRLDTIICQGKYMQQDLLAHYGIDAAKTIIINNATAKNKVDEIRAKQIDKPYKFITVSRLSPEKGIERLIHAVGLLSVPFELYIIGDGKQKTVLQKLVATLNLHEQVFFKPENKTPFEGMEDADLFLLGSYYEGFPNALIEAGAWGIPAIAFDAAGGIAEIIENEKNGLLVDDNDIIGFASAINRALALPFNRHQIAIDTEKRFSVNKMVQAMENIFNEVIH